MSWTQAPAIFVSAKRWLIGVNIWSEARRRKAMSFVCPLAIMVACEGEARTTMYGYNLLD